MGKLEQKLTWRLYKAYFGGLITELGSHQMDVVKWCLGALPEARRCRGGDRSGAMHRCVTQNLLP